MLNIVKTHPIQNNLNGCNYSLKSKEAQNNIWRNSNILEMLSTETAKSRAIKKSQEYLGNLRTL